MRAAMEEGGGDWQQRDELTQTQRMTINAALRNATMQTEGLASVVRTLVDAIDIRIHRTRSFVAVWDKECGRFIKLATPVSEAAIDLVREPVEKGGQRSKVIDEVLKPCAATRSSSSLTGTQRPWGTKELRSSRTTSR